MGQGAQQLPEKVTLLWLISNVPVKFWISLVVVIFGAFMAGVKFRGTSMGESLFSGNKNSGNVSPLPVGDKRTTVSLSSAERLFHSGTPWPEGFDVVKLGDQASLVQSTYGATNVRLGTGWVSLSIKNGPFRDVAYYYDDASDPRINMVVFFCRNDDSYSLVKGAALQAFTRVRPVSSALGAVLTWEDLGGQRVQLRDQSYMIMPTRDTTEKK